MAIGDVQPYLRLVEHDLEVLGLLTSAASKSDKDVTDWQCTLLFYMACIYVKALGRLRNKDLQDHYQIKQWLNESPDLFPLIRSYRKLEDNSRDARYEGRVFTREEVSRLLRWFADVRDGVVKLLRAGGVTKVPAVDPALFLA
jgi:hypothetical protein